MNKTPVPDFLKSLNARPKVDDDLNLERYSPPKRVNIGKLCSNDKFQKVQIIRNKLHKTNKSEHATLDTRLIKMSASDNLKV